MNRSEAEAPRSSHNPSFSIRFEVRSYELDSLGHLNNAVYFSYMEEASFAFLKQHQLPFARFEKLGWYPIIARAEINYRREIVSGDSISVRGWPIRYGNTSMVIGYQFVRICSETRDREELVSEGERVWVFVDLKGNKIAVPSIIRTAFGEPNPG